MFKIFALFICFALISYASNLPLSIFDLSYYNQNINDWQFTDNKLLLTQQQEKNALNNFKAHYLSPWDPLIIKDQISQGDIYKYEAILLNKFDNSKRRPSQDQRHIVYGENFRELSKKWIDNIAVNMQLDRLKNLSYHLENRAITVTNTQARLLPTNDPAYYHYSFPGEGYPFDNLQNSSLFIGTPLYILTLSKDKNWAFVSSADFTSWVPTSKIAPASKDFIRQYKLDAEKNLYSIIKTKTNIFTNNQTLAMGYVGIVLPSEWDSSMTEESPKNQLLANTQVYYDFPVKNPQTGMAKIVHVRIAQEDIAKLPLIATQKNIARVMKTLINRPYGWGGLYFYNDCSQELKSLFTPFAIWLGRHSSNQVNPVTIDLSGLHGSNLLRRLKESNLTTFMSIAYIKGHVCCC